MIEEKFYVGYSDANKDFALSNVGLLRFFQNIVTIQGVQANDSLRTSSHGWFLTAYHVKFFKRPFYEHYINIKTWSHAIKLIQASREFEVYDDNAELITVATSNWARVNKETQRLEKVSQDIIDAYGQDPRTNFDSPWIEKLKECEKIDFEKEYTIDRNFIDTNNHMNNIAYLELANLILPDEVFAKPEINEFEIMYRKAIKLHDTIKCQYTETEKFYNISLKSLDNADLYAIIRFYKEK